MSEFSLIRDYFSRHALEGDEMGVGDDCAIITPPDHKQLVICTDTLVAGRHFVHETDAHAIGYKVVAVNLSDLSAMGAAPCGILLALSLPKHLNDKNWLKKFSQGIYDCCAPYGVKLVGGDTTQSDTLTINITAYGFIKKSSAIRRDGAKVGDVICVSGEIGTASFALHQILDDLYGDGHANSPTALDELPDDLRTALQYPTPQVELGQALLGYAHAMIDLSDGLVQDLGHILTSSNVAALLYLDDIPTHSVLQRLDFRQAMDFVLSGGDDYQLCCCLPQKSLTEFRRTHPEFALHKIGEVVAPTQTQRLRYYRNNRPFFGINPKGFDHFD